MFLLTKVTDRLNPSKSSTSADSDIEDASSGEMEEEGAAESAGDDFEVIKKEKAETSAMNGTGNSKANKRGKKGKK